MVKKKSISLLSLKIGFRSLKKNIGQFLAIILIGAISMIPLLEVIFLISLSPVRRLRKRIEEQLMKLSAMMARLRKESTFLARLETTMLMQLSPILFHRFQNHMRLSNKVRSTVKIIMRSLITDGCINKSQLKAINMSLTMSFISQLT